MISGDPVAGLAVNASVTTGPVVHQVVRVGTCRCPHGAPPPPWPPPPCLPCRPAAAAPRAPPSAISQASTSRGVRPVRRPEVVVRRRPIFRVGGARLARSSITPGRTGPRSAERPGVGECPGAGASRCRGRARTEPKPQSEHCARGGTGSWVRGPRYPIGGVEQPVRGQAPADSGSGQRREHAGTTRRAPRTRPWSPSSAATWSRSRRTPSRERRGSRSQREPGPPVARSRGGSGSVKIAGDGLPGALGERSAHGRPAILQAWAVTEQRRRGCWWSTTNAPWQA
jgi:hypothetical protein